MTKVDLDALKIDRSAAAPASKRVSGPRLLLFAFFAVVLFVAGSFLVPLLRPVRLVQTASVQAAGADSASTRTGVAEAAGWIEPEPFAVIVRPLVNGVLVDLPVLEGDVVKKGETLIGRIESAELMARHDRALADVVLCKAELEHADAKLRVARGLLEQKGGPRLALVRQQQEVVRLEAERLSLERDHDATIADRDAMAAELEGQERLLAAGASYPVALAKARASLRAADATVKSRAADVARTAGELEQAIEKRSIARELLADPRALRGEVDRQVTERARVLAKLGAAETERRVSERELAWCSLKAPMDGVVLKLLAAPGDSVGPMGKGVIEIYDPKKLQARIDVPLASIAGVRVGQDVEIRTEVASGVVTRGKVLRVQRESDLFKNTTQVKVRLLDPSSLLVPETLCRARFLMDVTNTDTGAPILFLVPRSAMRRGAVFVLDPRSGGRARRIAVEQVGERGDRVIVRGDLSLTLRLIMDPVEEHERVREEER